ncbi:hypothetical protein [Halorussus marinus]|uniref:hypothetical protein n=1 Tax=Halorussus marinus TaxID=2505976 RepID=UPI00106DEE2E|nr:hypothetical protein [Halorussus marinus]
MLHWDEDTPPMLDACLNSRDRTLVALAWDLGSRPGDLFDRTAGAATDHQYGLHGTLDGKTGRRSPVLVLAVLYARK